MECRIVRYGEQDRLDELHPILARTRPDLAEPAFPNNPVEYDADFPYLFYLIENEEILGSRRAMPDLLYKGGCQLPFAWCFDMHLTAESRGRGFGTRLMRATRNEFEGKGIISGGCFSAPSVIHIYKKLGYKVLGFAPKYALVRNSKPFLAEKITSAFASRILGSAVNVGLAMRSAIIGRSKAGVTVERLNPDSWGRMAGNEHWDRSRWHWDEDPKWCLSRLRESDEVLLVNHPRAGGCAMMVLRGPRSGGGGGNANRLSLMHYRLHANCPEAAPALGEALEVVLRATGADVADAISSSPELGSALRKRGFVRRGEGMTFVYHAPGPVGLDDAATLSDWHLTHFCSDGFLFD
jgi:GNAT superfamily N-acetyltransferase